MQEWLNWPAWKAVYPKGYQGSIPTHNSDYSRPPSGGTEFIFQLTEPCREREKTKTERSEMGYPGSGIPFGITAGIPSQEILGGEKIAKGPVYFSADRAMLA